MKLIGKALVVLGWLSGLAYLVLTMLYYFGTHGIAWGIAAILTLPLALLAAPFVALFLGHGGGLLFLIFLTLACIWLGYALLESERSAKSLAGRLMLAGGSMLAVFAILTLIGIPLGRRGLTTPSAVDEYMGKLQPILDPVTNASEEWTTLVDQHNQMGASQLSQQEALQMVQAELAAATKAYLAAREAATAIRLVVPPKEYQEAHLLMTESLQLMEQGFAEMKFFMELGLRGIVDHDRRLRANRLLAEADRVKQRALFEMPQ